MRYYSAKGFIFPIIIGVLIIIELLALITGAYIPSVFVGFLLLLLVWILFDTYYVIKEDQLVYKSAFIKGSISIDAIYEIERNKTMYSGFKPALANKGLIVKYNKYDDIYLSPKDAHGFIEALRQINPAIKIVV